MTQVLTSTDQLKMLLIKKLNLGRRWFQTYNQSDSTGPKKEVKMLCITYSSSDLFIEDFKTVNPSKGPLSPIKMIC